MSSSMYAGFAGAALVIASLFMPYFFQEGIEMNGLQFLGFATFLLIFCGIIISCISLVKNRWLNSINIAIGIICALLSIRFQADISNMGGSVGIGTWILFVGGIIASIAGIIGVFNKSTPIVDHRLRG